MSKPTYILGISAFYHDSAAALIKDGEIIAAAQEERFSRKKHDHNFPKSAVDYVLKEAGIKAKDLNFVAFYEKPFIKFERILLTFINCAPWGIRTFIKAIPLWLKTKLWTPDLIHKELEGFKGKIIYPEHHQSHAASAFFASPFEEAAILTIDAVGEWATTTFGVGSKNNIKLLSEISFPHSLGLLYSAFTYFTGFRVNSAEYKLMGLAPYGDPKYVDLILEELVNVKEDGSFRLNMKYFNYLVGLTMTNKRFAKLFGVEPRRPEAKLRQIDMDLARSIQVVTEDIVLRQAKYVYKQTKKNNLCLAGGVALNCVANGRLLREGPFKNIWVQPASGDAGGALGAALFAWYQYLGNKRSVSVKEDFQKGSLLGPEFSGQEIEKLLNKKSIKYKKLNRIQLVKTVAKLIKEENVIGWFQGRMEYGPRALGSRSILGDARLKKMQSVMNLKIKFRESFRPFAPTVLEENAKDYFDLDCASPYMLLVAPISESKRNNAAENSREGLDKLDVERSVVPAVTHVDYSARVQTVSADTNPLYYELIKEFRNISGCPVVINTSFNVRGEPIVCTPDEAYQCFMRTDMDYLVLGNFLLNKKDQPKVKRDLSWQKEFELD